MHQKVHIKVILFLTSLIYLTHVDATATANRAVRFLSGRSEQSEQSVFVPPQDDTTGPVLSYANQAEKIKNFIGKLENSVSPYKPDKSREAYLKKSIEELSGDKSLAEQVNQLKAAEQLAYLLLDLGNKNTYTEDNLAKRVQLSLNSIFLATASNNYVVFNQEKGILSLPSDSLKDAKEFIVAYKGEKIFLIQTDNVHKQSTAVSIHFDQNRVQNKATPELYLKEGVRQLDNDDCSLFAYWSVLKLMTLMTSIGGKSASEFLCEKILILYNAFVVIADPNALQKDADLSLDKSILTIKYNEPPVICKPGDERYDSFAKVIEYTKKYPVRFFIAKSGAMLPYKLVNLSIQTVPQSEGKRLFYILNNIVDCQIVNELRQPTPERLIAYIMMQYSGLIASSKSSTQSQVANLFLADDSGKQNIQKFHFEFDANNFVESTEKLIGSIQYTTTKGLSDYFHDGDQTKVLETIKQYIAYIQSVS